jgi:ubiquinone/menaquinone biosynthesis C-methylase UbiE
MKLDEVIHVLSCPDDSGDLELCENFLKCTICEKSFLMPYNDTVILLPSNSYHPSSDNTRKDYFDWYDNLKKGTQYNRKRNKPKFLPTKLSLGIDNEISSKIPSFKDEMVCEVGSGRRALSLKYAKFSKIIFHTDMDLDDIEYVRMKAKTLGLNNMIFIMCNYFHLPFKHNSIDNLICTGNLGRHGIDHDRKLTKEICQKTKINGNVIVDFSAKERTKIPYAKKDFQFAFKKIDILDFLTTFGLSQTKTFGIGYIPIIHDFSLWSYKIGNFFSKLILPPSRWLTISKNPPSNTK